MVHPLYVSLGQVLSEDSELDGSSVQITHKKRE